jgi:hypothetical protein
MHSTPTSSGGAAPPRLAPSLVALFAIGAGLSVAGLYYNQPILGAMAADLGATPGQASQALVRYGWSGVMTLGAAAATLALVVRSLPERGAAPTVNEA